MEPQILKDSVFSTSMQIMSDHFSDVKPELGRVFFEEMSSLESYAGANNAIRMG